MRKVLTRVFSTLARFRVHLIILYLLILVAALVRIHEVLLISPLDDLSSDPGRHWEHAKQTVSPSPWQIIDPPIFQMWVSLVQKWSMADRGLVAFYASCMSLATPFVWYLFFREALYSRTLALVGCALIAWLPSWIPIYSYFMTETLFLPLMGLCLRQTIRASRTQSIKAFCGMVALWGVTSLTRGIAVPMGGMVAGLVWLGHRHKIATALTSILVAAMIAVPFAVRNHNYLRLWSPIGTGWPSQVYTESGKKEINLELQRQGAQWWYGFGSPSLYTKPLAPLSDWESRRKGAVKVSIDIMKGSADWKAGYEANAVHGWERMKLRLENVIFVMLGPSWPDNHPKSPMAQVANTMRWLWAPLFVVVLVISAFRPRSWVKPPYLAVQMVVWFAFQAASLLAVNEGRYRKPLEGLLIAQVIVLWDSRRLRAWQPDRRGGKDARVAPLPASADGA